MASDTAREGDTADEGSGDQPPGRDADIRRPDPDAPGTYVDDEDAPEVPEPNEPA